MNVYQALAVAALLLHLAWILWVLLGWLVTRNRPWLRWFHIVSLVYGIFIEIGPWPCPLTIAEQWFQTRAGIQPYRRPFLIHYLEMVVYPNVSPALVTWCGAGLCVFLLGLYGWRFRRRRIAGWW